MWRRHEGKFSKANFSPTQCRFSFSRVEKTFLPVSGSYENVCCSTYFVFLESRFRVDLNVTPWQTNLCKQDICTAMIKIDFHVCSWICSLLSLKFMLTLTQPWLWAPIHGHRVAKPSVFLFAAHCFFESDTHVHGVCGVASLLLFLLSQLCGWLVVRQLESFQKETAGSDYQVIWELN